MIFLRLLSALPFSILYGISDFIFLMTYHIVRYRRHLVRQNLTHAFPDKSPSEVLNIERAFYRNLCDYGVETLKLLTVKKEDLVQRMHFTNPELLERYRDRNQSVIILTSHQFNWEWMLSAGHLQLPLPVDFVYQSVNNKLFNAFSLKTRTRFGGHAITREEVAREVIRRKDVLRAVAIVADQYPGKKKDKRFPLTFMGRETMFFEGANQLAILMQYPVVFAAVRKSKRGHYYTSFVNIAEPPYSKTDTHIITVYAAEVERLIRENPSGWLWSHRRWKKRHLKQNQPRT
jgi:Kdo2-lipid IVA lauroyltransferase/acyltransferase